MKFLNIKNEAYKSIALTILFYVIYISLGLGLILEKTSPMDLVRLVLEY